MDTIQLRKNRGGKINESHSIRKPEPMSSACGWFKIYPLTKNGITTHFVRLPHFYAPLQFPLR